MTKPLPRWARHRCQHERVQVATMQGRVLRDHCLICGATFPIAAPTQDPTP